MTKKTVTTSDTTTNSTYTDAEYLRDIKQHIALVQQFMHRATDELTHRADTHDASKCEEPERSIFQTGMQKRDSVPYGSPEYHTHMKDVQVALDHHYAHNRHHPEHHICGVRDMNLMDLLEMLCDWMAASLKSTDGDLAELRRVIDINQERFGYSDELRGILHNTAAHLLIQKEAES